MVKDGFHSTSKPITAGGPAASICLQDKAHKATSIMTNDTRQHKGASTTVDKCGKPDHCTYFCTGTTCHVHAVHEQADTSTRPAYSAEHSTHLQA